MKKLAILIALLFHVSCVRAEVIYRLDGNDIAQEEFWTSQNLTNLTNRMAATTITINPAALGIPSRTGQSGKGLSTNGTVFQWTAFESPLTFSTGLTRSTNTITVNAAQNISQLTNLSTNGVVTAINGNGTLSVVGATSGTSSSDDLGKFPLYGNNGSLTAGAFYAGPGAFSTSGPTVYISPTFIRFLTGAPNLYASTLQSATVTTGRTWTLPDKSGTVAMTSDIVSTITLTGDVTGSGTGSFATTIGSGKVTLAKIAAAAMSSGGNSSADSGKLVTFDSNGAIAVNSIVVETSTSSLSISPSTFSAQNMNSSGFSYLLSFATPTANRAVAFPNKDGTLAVTADITLANLPQTGATTGQVAAWNGSNWAPSSTLSATRLTNLSTDGVVTVSGSNGTLGTTGTSVGGFRGSDNGKVALFSATGQLTASGAITIVNQSTSALGYLLSTGLTFQNLGATMFQNDVTFTTPTANRSVAFPDKSGTVALTSDILTASALLDTISSTRGSILYRGASGWAVLTPGTSGYALTSNGSGADPSYQAVSGGSGSLTVGTSTITSGTGGRLLYETSGNKLGEISGITSTGSTLTIATSGASSTPPFTVSGAPYVAGSAGVSAATKALVLIETSGATSSAWNNYGTLLGVNAASGFQGSIADFQFNGSSKLNLSYYGSLSMPATTNVEALNITGFSLASASPGNINASIINLAGTWNGGVSSAPTAIKLNITDTSSSATNSYLMDLQKSSTSMFSVRKDGYITVGSGGGFFSGSGNSLYLGNSLTFGGILRVQEGAGLGLEIPSNTSYRFSSDTTSYGTVDLTLSRKAAATLQLGVDVNGNAVSQTIRAPDGITGTDRSGGDLILSSGATTGTGTSAVVFKAPLANGTGTAFSTPLERARVTGAGLQVGKLILWGNPSAAPSSSPPSGFYYMYVDPTDNSVKIMSSSGNITTLAVP